MRTDIIFKFYNLLGYVSLKICTNIYDQDFFRIEFIKILIKFTIIVSFDKQYQGCLGNIDIRKYFLSINFI